MATFVFVVLFGVLSSCGSVAAQAVPTVQPIQPVFDPTPTPAPPDGGVYIVSGDVFSIGFGPYTYSSLYWEQDGTNPGVYGSANLVTIPCGEYFGVFVVGTYGSRATCAEAIVRVYSESGMVYAVRNKSLNVTILK